jgi:hypothetical protein
MGISAQLTKLSNRRLSNQGLRDQMRAALTDETQSLVSIYSQSWDGIIVAQRQFERNHIAGWPAAQQLDVRRQVVQWLGQNRSLSYDWVPYSDDGTRKIEYIDTGSGPVQIIFHDPRPDNNPLIYPPPPN